MILFYNKKTGNIVGTIDGRIHNEGHLKMWVGTKEENERLIIDWIPTKFYDKEGKEVGKKAVNKKGESLVFTADFTPNHKQKEIFVEIEQRKKRLTDFKVDIVSKLLVSK